MSYVQGAWVVTTVGTGRNKTLVMKCTVTSTTSETDCITPVTPEELDPTRPWMFIVNAESTDTSDQTDPIDLYAGYAAGITSTSEGSTATVTGGAVVVYASVGDDCSDEFLTVVVDPTYTGTAVTASTGVGGHVNVGTAPYYVISVNGGGARKAADTVFYIIQ